MIGGDCMKNKQNRLNVQRLELRVLDRCIIVIASMLVLMVLLFFNMYIYKSENSQIDMMKLIMEQTSENQKAQFEACIDEKIQLLQTLVTYPDIYEMNDTKQKDFIKKRSEGLGFHHIFVMSKDGFGYYIDENVYRNQKEEPFFADVMNNDVFVTEPFYTAYGPVMTVCVSIYDEQKVKVGSLCGAVTLDSLQQLIGEDEMVLNGKYFIVNKRGNYVTSVNSVDLNSQKSIYSAENSELSLLKAAFKEKANQEGTLLLDGTEYQAHLTYLNNYNWVIVQIVPMSEITERYEVMSNLQCIVFFLALALILCIVRIFYCWKMSDKKIYTDALTKCNSRAACISLIEKLDTCFDYEVGIVYLDLNKFKYVNDTYGHDKGDQLLCIFGSVLMEIMGTVGFVGRMGGDEFVAFFIDVSEQEIYELWQQVEKELIEKSKNLDFSYEITASYGYAARPRGSKESLDVVMQKADEKMYAYKVALKE